MCLRNVGVRGRATEVAVCVVTVAMVTSLIAMSAAAGTAAGDGGSPALLQANLTESDQRSPAVYGQRLRTRLADASPNETVRAIVVLEDQPDVRGIRGGSASREGLVGALEGRTRATQAPVTRAVERLRDSDEVRSYERFWLVNALAVAATPGAIRELGRTDGVAVVLADVELTASDRSRAPAGRNNESVRTDDSNVTIERVDRIARSATAPGPLDARSAVSLPESVAVSDPVAGLDVAASSAPEPITGAPSDDVPAAASTPFDGDGVAWGVERIRADAAAHEGYDGSNVTVAVIDTGIDDSHPDLDGRVVGWTDLVNGFGNPYDDGGHGTHVAGTIAGTGEGGIRTGVAPGADLLGVKVLDGGGSGYLSDVLAGMQWAVRNDADVMSLSLGGPHDPLFHLAADRAAAAGVIPVVAAGNIGGSRDPFTVDLRNLLAVTDPGHARSAVTVGATHWQDRIAWFSARESFSDDEDRFVKPDVVAPGTNVTSARAGGDGYERFSGTSMATPHVAGVAALIVQADPSASPEAVRRLLGRTAVDLGEPGPDDTYGAGRVDARAALAAADDRRELDIEVDTNETGNGTTVTAVATLTDGSGAPVAGANVSLNAVYGPPSALETHKADAGLYAHSGARPTDENGTARFRFGTAEDTRPGGTYTVQAVARGGLVRTETTVELEEEVEVTARSLNDTVRRNGDTVVLELEARDTAGEPANVTIDAVLRGPTNDRLPNWNRTVRTGDDGIATAAVELPDDLLEIYRGLDPQGGGPSFGRYDLVTVVRDDDGDVRDYAVHDGVVDVEPRWTDLEIDGSETPLAGVADLETWQGNLTIGERVTASLQTTQPRTDYDVVLAEFDPGTNGTDGSTNGTRVPLGSVTTDEAGSATVDLRVPPSTPGGYYAIIAVPPDRNLTDPGPIGSYDVGYVHVRALETDVSIESREDATNRAFQPGEAVRITVTTRNASTGAPTDPRDLTLRLAGFTDFTSIRRTAPGTIEMNARFVDRGSPDGVVRAAGLDQNGGSFGNHTERATARPFAIQILPDARSYEPGANATLDVRVADSESGAPVAGAELRVILTGLTATGSWRSNRTLRTDQNGTARIRAEIPANAVGIDVLASDVLVVVTSIEKGADLASATTGFELDRRHRPSISVSQNGSESVGLFGLNDVSIYEPGDRIAFDVRATGVDPGVAADTDRYADLIAVKYSKVGDGSYVFDANESETAIVPLDEQGRGTYEYRLREDADPGLVVPIVSTRINGVTLADSQLGIVGARPLNVSANRSAVGPGEAIAFETEGDVPPRADVDFVVKRAGSQGQVPIAAVDDGAPPDIGSVTAHRNRTLARADPLARDVVTRLPDRFGNRDALRGALLEALVPAMSARLSSGAGGAAIDADSRPATRTDAAASDAAGTFVVPENAAPGRYRVIAIVHSDDGSVKERIGFATFEVEE